MLRGDCCQVRRAAGHSLWDHGRNEEVMKRLHTPQITEFIEKCRRNWEESVGRISGDRIHKKILKYQLKGKRSLGRPRKRWKDSVM
jgi:hypothetical protein